MLLRILTGKTHLQIKLKCLRKVCIWAFARTSSQLFIRGFYTEIKFPKKNKAVFGQTPFFVIGPFYTPHSIYLIALTFSRTILYESVVFSIVVFHSVLRLLLYVLNAV